MAISAVVTFHVRDGRQGEQVENLKAVKRLVERGGGTFRVHRQLFGSQVNHLFIVSEFKDWNGFAKVRSDPEFSQLVERFAEAPTRRLTWLAQMYMRSSQSKPREGHLHGTKLSSARAEALPPAKTESH